MMMDRWRLQLFREVAIRGTLAAAAEAAAVTPSAVSQQIAALEKATGVSLFERVGRGVQLTAHGEVLLTSAEQVLEAFASAESVVAGLKEEVSGHVKLGCFASAATTFIPSVICQVQARFPRLKVVLYNLEPKESMAELAAGDMDIVVVDDHEPTVLADTKHLVARFLLDDALYAVLPADHPHAHQEAIALEDLADDNWLLADPRSYFYAVVVDACARAGFTPEVAGFAREVRVIAAMASAGLGVGILPGLATHDLPDSVAVRRLSPYLGRRIFAVTKGSRTSHPAIQAVLGMLESTTSDYAVG